LEDVLGSTQAFPLLGAEGWTADTGFGMELQELFGWLDLKTGLQW